MIRDLSLWKDGWMLNTSSPCHLIELLQWDKATTMLRQWFPGWWRWTGSSREFQRGSGPVGLATMHAVEAWHAVELWYMRWRGEGHGKSTGTLWVGWNPVYSDWDYCILLGSFGARREVNHTIVLGLRMSEEWDWHNCFQLLCTTVWSRQKSVFFQWWLCDSCFRGWL